MTALHRQILIRDNKWWMLYAAMFSWNGRMKPEVAAAVTDKAWRYARSLPEKEDGADHQISQDEAPGRK